MAKAKGARSPGPTPAHVGDLLLANLSANRQLGVVALDNDRRVIYWNAGAEQIFGPEPQEALGQTFATIVTGFPKRDDGSPPGDALPFSDSWADTSPYLRRKDGAEILVGYSISPLRDLDGSASGVLILARDATSRLQVEAVREELAAELRVSHAQLEAILQSSAEGITVQGPSGRILFANPAAARMIGYDSIEALLAAPRGETLRPLHIMREDGSPFPIDELPGRRALRGEQPPETVERYRARETGEERYSLVQARPIFDEIGNVQFAVITFRDITEPYRERERLQFLDEASAVLASSLDYDATLAGVAQLAVPRYADWAAIDLVQEDGTIRQVALAHADAEKVSWARELALRYPPDPNGMSGAPQVIRTGEAELFREISQEMLEAAAIDEEHLRIIDQLQISSALVVPLRAREGVLGALSFVYGGSDRHYAESDLRWAQDLADRAATAVENARLYRDAREALQVRDEFLATISHDLRTPLTTIRGLTQLVLRQSQRAARPNAERMTESLREVDRASRAMSRMIDELLDLSRIESGRPLTLNSEVIDPGLLVREVAEEYRLAAPRHSLVVTIGPDIAGGDFTCYWDAPRIERVLINLLSNAVKYSPDGGTITVTLEGSRDDPEPEDVVIIQVRDEGIGIPAADLPAIFERYHRASNVIGRISGLGIGLAGAKQIVEQHGGSLSAKSEEGRGSLFTVRLPRNANPLGHA
ncbi:MAG TPA: PAS domain-containing sensor histidine kinase [Dehalococcoidia bacterium]|nr:PAS domain-containing sensor histidine kinase [Dehalococcoidia bacterium]